MSAVSAEAHLYTFRQGEKTRGGHGKGAQGHRDKAEEERRHARTQISRNMSRGALQYVNDSSSLGGVYWEKTGVSSENKEQERESGANMRTNEGMQGR